jgi:hypothetical protein
VQVTIGRMVHYTLSETDAEQINRRRKDFQAAQSASAGLGYVGHVGNQVQAGEAYPATVVRVFDPSSGTANLQVHLDGNDIYWATSRREGSPGETGCWIWPPRV